MYLPDLSPYHYAGLPESGVVHVGWLDRDEVFPRGEVAESLLEKLQQLARNPVRVYRGLHVCNLCDGASGTGEVRVPGSRVVYAAPVLIVHYIRAHGYLPPSEFLSALAVMPAPSQSRGQRDD